MSQSFVFIFVALVASTFAQSSSSSSSSGNIYGYNYDSNALASGPFLVQNPNYQFLNDQLANEYAQTYQQELKQYDSSATGTSSGSGSGSSSSSTYNDQIPVSQTYVPVNGYYYGPVMTNAQQNTLNYQQITQRNPSSSASSSTNIYGYNTGSSSSASSTYNNQQMYSAPSASTATPYIYPFGQYASSSSSSSTNQVLRDSGSSSSLTSGSSSSGSNSDVGQTYSLFYNDQTATPAYQSQSDLKTTTLRDQALPSNVNLRGTGPLPGPTLGSSNTLTQQFNDAGSNAYYYSSGNANLNSNSGSARVKKASRFFDVAGNQTEMYYPYRTSTNYNTVNSNSATGSGSGSVTSGNTGTFYDSVTAATTTAQKCQLSDPYWCADYVNVYVSAKRNYTSESTQTICTELIASLAESYNGCCTAVRSAGCSM